MAQYSPRRFHSHSSHRAAFESRVYPSPSLIHDCNKRSLKLLLPPFKKTFPIKGRNIPDVSVENTQFISPFKPILCLLIAIRKVCEIKSFLPFCIWCVLPPFYYSVFVFFIVKKIMVSSLKKKLFPEARPCWKQVN